MDKKVLFLTLRIFSATGGIEKICKVISLALNELFTGIKGGKLQVFSMYDKTSEADKKYINSSTFRGYNQQKVKFTWHAIVRGTSMDIVILSHINLLSVGYIIKLLSPKTKLVLYTHGIEVWGPLSGLRKKMLHKCDRIISVSNYTKEKMIQHYQLPGEKITVLNNCLDPYLPPAITTGKDSSLMKKYGFDTGNQVLMTLSRLSSKELYKGYDHVLYSINELKQKFPGLKYLIVGRYDDAEKKRLDEIINFHSLQQYVVFTGYVPDEDLARHYSLADVYVMPSKKEGFGIVFIEAMHYGLPVIAGNKDGSVDALCNGELGVLVNPDDQAEINTVIERVLLNKENYKPNINILNESFSYHNYLAKLENILTSTGV